MIREPQCAHCDHDRSSHHKEFRSTGEDVTQTREPVWFACLAPFCNCRRFVSPGR